MNEWSLVYNDFNPDQEPLREALCTLGNGYFATRGAAPESHADTVHYPATYLAGGYNRLETHLAGRTIENEDLVNFPNWLYLTFRIDESGWFNLGAVNILAYRQELNLQHGALFRTIRFEDRQGRRSVLESRRFVHLGYEHLGAIETTLTAENWSGRLHVRSGLDGRVVNAGVKRYQTLNRTHHQPLESFRVNDEGIYLKVETSQSRLQVAEAAITRVLQREKPLAVERVLHEGPGFIADELSLDMAPGQPITIEKIIALYTSRDRGISECGHAARYAIAHVGSFEQLFQSHIRRWNRLWKRCDVRASSDASSQHVLRLHVFHLLQTVSPNTIDLDVGVPARGLHGEAYRGHIFWDELFIFPLLNLRIPDITRALLMYRHRRLDSARQNAREAGCRGAMYPWQSGSSGREESQVFHLNPQSGRWAPDNSSLQRHVNAAIAYNVWQYYQVTGDHEFMTFYGAEMIIEIARFWASLSTYNPALDRYEISRVMGPDEYHDSYPDADEPGLNNNTYTNILAVWVLCRALETLDMLTADSRMGLREILAITESEAELWKDISHKMRVTFHDDGIISQFEGYEQLEEFNWEGYRKKYGNIQRLDRILEAEGDTPNRYKLSKQADVLMLFYLFSSEELKQLFARLDYPFSYKTIPKNIDYYLKRTAHGSSLSRVVHAWVLARSDRERSWKLFEEALHVDLTDVQGGTTPEGIHLGAMAGTVDLLQRGHTGIEVRGGVLYLNPCLPSELNGLKMCIDYRGHLLDITLTQDSIKIVSQTRRTSTIEISINDAIHRLQPGEAIATNYTRTERS